MITPMRRFDINVTEVFLSDMGNIFAILLFLLAVATGFFRSWFDVTGFWGGMLCFATFTTGLLLGAGQRWCPAKSSRARSRLLFSGADWRRLDCVWPVSSGLENRIGRVGYGRHVFRLLGCPARSDPRPVHAAIFQHSGI